MIELINIYEYNGKKIESPYNNRKTVFQDTDELDKYRVYLSNKLGKQIFFDYKQKEKNNSHALHTI